MDDPAGKTIEIDPKDAAGLTLLRRLVTGLLGVMIVGFLVLIGLLVTRFPDFDEPSATTTPTAASFDLPKQLDLPEGVTPQAFTRGGDWVAIVATDANAVPPADVIYIFDAQSGALRQRLDIK